MQKHLIYISLFFLVNCKKVDVNINSSVTDQVQPVKSYSPKPNIILILGDDIGYEVPAYTGGQSYSTPNIDQLSQNSVVFTQCHGSPLCSPSRFMLLTGKYNFRNYTQWGIMDSSQRTIANMLHDAGYKTALYGKWQFGGGDASIRNFGFDNYTIYNPFTGSGNEERSGSRYKNPHVFENGNFLADSLVQNKYADDIFTDSVINFIDSNAAGNQPFFIYYPLVLCHPPFSPTPDDPEFASWNPYPKVSDSVFYPSMIKYMDKKIGEIVNEVNTHLQNTVIIYIVGDNGTPANITSLYNGQLVPGGKSLTNERGTHVPMMVYWQGKTSHAVNNDLIDFTDFLPTIARIANLPLPQYGKLDGVSFSRQIDGLPGNPRQQLYYWYNSYLQPDNRTRIWVQDKIYKLYDGGGFFNIASDPEETIKLPTVNLSEYEKDLRASFQKIMDTEQ